MAGTEPQLHLVFGASGYIGTNLTEFLVADADLRDARLKLILGVRQVLRNGLNLLGVSAPEKM